eukprot:6962604-Prymnesium_polylepis.2
MPWSATGPAPPDALSSVATRSPVSLPRDERSSHTAASADCSRSTRCARRSGSAYGNACASRYLGAAIQRPSQAATPFRPPALCTLRALSVGLSLVTPPRREILKWQPREKDLPSLRREIS